MFYDRDTFYWDKEFGLEFDLLYEFGFPVSMGY
jgi:hypothetical protein